MYYIVFEENKYRLQNICQFKTSTHNNSNKKKPEAILGGKGML